MASLGALGIGLSVVFVGFVLALVGELCYLIFWKKRGGLSLALSRNRGASILSQQQDESDAETEQVSVIANRHQSYNLASKLIHSSSDESLAHQCQSHYQFMGPPRFLFTIREETREELESESICNRNGSLDFALQIQQQQQQHHLSEPSTPCDTPFATPPSSPSIFTTPPATPPPTYTASGSGYKSSGPGMGLRALAREPMHCTILIPSLSAGSAGTVQRMNRNSNRTTMMMLLLNPTPGSPPGMSPAASPTAAAYSTPPTHLYSPRMV